MNKPLDTDELIDHVHKAPGFLLWQIEMCWQRIVNKVLLELGLTYTQFIVLGICGWLSKSQENVYQHQIARHSKIDRMMTSRILASLEKKGYIKRLKIDGDARAKLAILTPKGKKILDLSLKKVSEIESNFFKPSHKSFVDSMDDILSDCINL
ncbi:MarR family winged helix-turn-helix transcriptional regulator [Paradesertivirga mongoliensis]|uniref:MarR family winged helix-turn-helix transcriptional regulator n=1 Tax=Paradesertivirga mongoliensis TaxID=2100740 RepID=A0ABW4ZHC1_9SPHI|nr:MarR family transcriptional regulator [Pedobacter mongoliensis]